MSHRILPSTRTAIDLLYFSKTFITPQSKRLVKTRRQLARKLHSLHLLDRTTLKYFLK